MGIKLLTAFMDKNDDLMLMQELHNSFLVIDGRNLIHHLFKKSQKSREDLFGSDLISFSREVKNFYTGLSRCNIEPIVVVDGASSEDKNYCKSKIKLKRAFARFNTVKKTAHKGKGTLSLNPLAPPVFQSLTVDMGIRLVQAMHEADPVIARLAAELDAPILSDDSDFLLMDIPRGIISNKNFLYDEVKNQDGDNPHSYIDCKVFRLDYFISFFPDLRKDSIPLVGPLIGNDFVRPEIFSNFCNYLSQTPYGDPKTLTKGEDRILRTLFLLRGSSLSENINKICKSFKNDKQKDIKDLLRAQVKHYQLEDSCEDLFAGLKRIYMDDIMRGSEIEYHPKCDNLDEVISWLKHGMEGSTLENKFLQLLTRNNVIIRPYMDDDTQPSAQECQYQSMAVMLSMMRAKISDNRPCFLYDRVGSLYQKVKIKPAKYLENFGELRYVIFDVPKLPILTKQSILLASFESCHADFDRLKEPLEEMMDTVNVYEISLVKVLINYINSRSETHKLQKQFRSAVMISIMFYRSDLTLGSKMDSCASLKRQLNGLHDSIKKRKLPCCPKVSQSKLYNIRLVHQITQLQSTIIAYNNLVALLGMPLPRLCPETWFNSSLIYNLTDKLQEKSFVTNFSLPSFVLKY